MCSRFATKARCNVVFALGFAGVLLGGCSDIYYDRRDTISLSTGDAIAADQITQMVDPWPRASANKNIAFNGVRMRSAVERYQTNHVIPPVSATTSSAAYNQTTPAQSGAPLPASGGDSQSKP